MRLLVTGLTTLALGMMTPAAAPAAPPAPAGAQAAPAPAVSVSIPDRYVIPGDRAFPTGMALDPRTGHYYVGSAEDGTLYRGHVSRPEARVWSPDGTDGRSFTSGMTLDGRGRLFVNGGDTGTTRIYDTGTGRLLAKLDGTPGGFVNDVTLADDGAAYVTDSFLPVVYRVARQDGRWTMEPWLDVDDSPVDWVHGQHILNGIIAVGPHLLAIQSNTGRLWRIDRATREVGEVDLGGHRLVNGDGLAWRDGRLYVTQGNLFEDPAAQAQVAVVELNDGLTRGRQVAALVPPEGFQHPSAIAIDDSPGRGTEGAKSRLLVVNSQFNRWQAGLPPQTLPFTLATVRVPTP
ncbi:SMP-30/gluconolactonase/LRE family protein [Streptomyces sp. NPDC058653]|uniref:SMP-30/gluconolactonase/LRE family protein n=1 Tax=Streptomyces sp. NPDC058653 TaxID=3346576 RepID=UPI0036540E4D